MPMTAAQMAGFRGKSRINQDNRHAGCLRLICYKLPQLVKAPTLVAVALRLARPGTLAYARQILQGNLPLGHVGRCDDLLTDAVVHRSHMTLLSARQPF